jgi:cyclic pyranopterin monophosphate synthase
MDKGKMSHVDEAGRIRMVDVGRKPITERTAIASGFVRLTPTALDAVDSRRMPKGDPLEAARLAGIMAAKRTSDLIPLCHPLKLTHVDIQLEQRREGIAITAQVSAAAQTGVEMEALTAVSVAALTLYDMCKAVDKGIVIGDIRLERKAGGRVGRLRPLDRE